MARYQEPRPSPALQSRVWQQPKVGRAVGGPIKLLSGAAGLPPEVRHTPRSDDPKGAAPRVGNEGENQSKICRDPSPAPQIPSPVTVQDTKEFSVTWE